jgi:hypothetical protein
VPERVRKALDAAWLPAGPAVKASWLEGSVSTAAEGVARFTHCYSVRDGAGLGEHQAVWERAYRRFLALLLALNEGGGRFDVGAAVRIQKAFAGTARRWPALLVSAEWPAGSDRFLKATVYVGTHSPLGKAGKALAAISKAGVDWMGPLSESFMDVVGADFGPGGEVEFKVYRNFPRGASRLTGRAKRFAASLGDKYASTYRAYKFRRPAGRPYLYKTHFSFEGGLAPGRLLRSGYPGAARAASLFGALAPAGARITAAGLKPRGGELELYFS